ncbi:MAG: hypothetical protein AUK47_13835 [Deltaproteobacteria bacterium CG2_30_63_29]|nr:MAG: hypothetical protein AUK47_13835 [Deltaproteobacteria bacterium CG2_30_63_29]
MARLAHLLQSGAMDALLELVEPPWTAELLDAIAEQFATASVREAARTLDLAGQCASTSAEGRAALIRLAEVGLASTAPSVRSAALQALLAAESFEKGAAHYFEEPSWKVRADLIDGLELAMGAANPLARAALDDPHWRTRERAIQALAQRVPAPDPDGLSDGTDPRTRGAVAYLRNLTDETPDFAYRDESSPEDSSWGLSGRDPALVHKHLEELRPDEARALLDAMPAMLAHEHEGVRAWALKRLLQWGTPEHCVRCVELLADPRVPFVAELVETLTTRLDEDRRVAAAKRILDGGYGPRVQRWAERVLGQVAPSIVADSAPPSPQVTARLLTQVQEAAERLAREARTSATGGPMPDCEPDSPMPDCEPDSPMPDCEPDSPMPDCEPDSPSPDCEPDSPTGVSQRPPQRPLGNTGLLLSPLALSGHYGLPELGFRRGLEAGINTFFWEPNYSTLIRFFRDLTPEHRRQTEVVAGTFHADAKRVRADAERALRSLHLEQLGVYLLFWVRDAARLEPLLPTLQALQREGKVKTYGFSTHQRALALEHVQSQAPWPTLMLRHNGAHRGAEAEVFPTIKAAGCGLLTFSALCYSRMLERPHPAAPAPPDAAECYRYSMQQPGVTSTMSAPRSIDELGAGLRALRAGPLEPERVAQLQEFGDAVLARNRAFAECVRWR